MRTATKDSPTKAKLLDAAQKLILENGFVGTSVDEICKAAKLTKGSFFHYFESKEKLGVELLTRYCASAKEKFKKGCCQEEKDPLKRIYNFLDCMIEMGKQNPHGCLLGGMSQELADSHPDIRSICSEAFKGLAEGMTGEFEKAKKMHAPKASWTARSLANQLVTLMQGSLLLGKVTHDKRFAEDSIRHFKGYLEHLFGK